jgi:hypothetical protein
MKYITLNGDVYIKIDRLTARKACELLVVKCRQLYISAYTFIRFVGGL